MPINDMRETSNNNNDNKKLITCPMCGSLFYNSTSTGLTQNRMIIIDGNSPPRHYR